MDATNGKVLGSVNAHMHLPIASTTKIMTALLAVQFGDLSDRIRVPKSAFNYESDATVMGLHPGQIVTLRDLLYGLMLPSGADAANTIAIHYGGSEAGFVALMNREAVTLGMHDTHYANAHGLTAKNHYSSAYDLAVLAQYVSYQQDLMKVASTHSYTWNGHVLTNLNRVLYWYPGVDGIKPGYTDDAGLCQVLDVQRHYHHAVVVLLNTPNLDTDARNLLNFGLQDYSWVQSRLPGDNPAITQVGTDRLGRYVYFPASGHYIHGAFATAFMANGGYMGLGLPRTEPLHGGQTKVQYFQNGALSMDASGRVKRLSLGTLSFPAPKPTPTPSPVPSATPTPRATPREGTVVPGATASKPTPTPRPRATPTPRPATLTPTRTPGTLPPALTASMFLSFQHAHRSLLGSALSSLNKVKNYAFQIFTYGALLYDTQHHQVYRLPVGDRLLSGKRYLPDYPGNTYPPGFASLTILKAIGWLPHTTLQQLRPQHGNLQGSEGTERTSL
ncbi:MAG: hypothetical protein NVSMB52_18090 [Chloroflexota bacterium]